MDKIFIQSKVILTSRILTFIQNQVSVTILKTKNSFSNFQSPKYHHWISLAENDHLRNQNKTNKTDD